MVSAKNILYKNILSPKLSHINNNIVAEFIPYYVCTTLLT